MPAGKTVHIAFDCRAVGVPFPHFWEVVVGSGHAALYNRRDLQEHLKMGVDEEVGLQSQEFWGGFGLVTMRGVKKPAFNGFKLLGMLSTTRLLPEESPELGVGEGVVATSDEERGEVCVLAWNFLHPRDPGANAGRVAAFDVELSGLPPGEYLREVFLVDESFRNVRRAWAEMGEPASPTREHLSALKEVAELRPLGRDEIAVGAGGEYCFPLELGPMATTLVRLGRRSPQKEK
ncbi:MAG: GH39 family glycosyl hydrolase [Promethearchaeota archaeon]